MPFLLEPEMPDRIARKVLLIGWDAADWQMIRPLLAKGWMPTLARLMESGTWGNLATIQPILSPMLWNSIATGKRADKHGICGFVEPAPDRSGIRPVSSTSRKCKAIWNICSQNGLTSNVVSWFASHPAEPIRGAVVTDRYVAQVAATKDNRTFPAGTFRPAELENHLAQLLVTPAHVDAETLRTFIPRAAEIDQKTDDRLVKLASVIARASSAHAAACHLAANTTWDLLAVYYAAIDEFGHFFMPYHPPRLAGVSEHDAAIYGEVMAGCYRFSDMMLESLLAYAGPDTTVVLVSDHGFKSGQERPGPSAWERPDTWHRAFGIACLAGPGIRRGDQLYGATLLDVTPTILTLLGLPIGGDMDGRPWLEVFNRPIQAEVIPTWEMVEGDAGLHTEDLREDPADAAEVVRRLVELGYVEAPGPDAEESVRRTIRDRKVNLAVALSTSRRAADAIPIWRELAEQYPDEVAFRIQLASCLLRLGRLSESRQVVAELDEQNRHSIHVQLMRASLAIEDGNSAEALQLVRQVASSGTQDPTILNRVGELFLGLNDRDEASLSFKRSLALMSDNPVAHDGLSQVAIRSGRFAEAAEHALLAVGLTHYFPAAHAHLGEALHALDKPNEAISAFETALAMGYKPQSMHRALAILYKDRDPDRFRMHAERA